MTPDISTLDFVAFDTETTGLYATSEALLEIGAVRFNLIAGPTEYFQTLINPGRSIPYAATRIHGITDEMVFEAPKLEKVMPAFFHFMNGAIPVAHNAPFDLSFVALHGLRLGLELPKTPVLDTCTFARRVLTEMPNHKLVTLTKELALTTDSTFHRALADAKNCMQLFRHLIDKSCGKFAPWSELLEHHGNVNEFVSGSRTI